MVPLVASSKTNSCTKLPSVRRTEIVNGCGLTVMRILPTRISLGPARFRPRNLSMVGKETNAAVAGIGSGRPRISNGAITNCAVRSLTSASDISQGAPPQTKVELVSARTQGCEAQTIPASNHARTPRREGAVIKKHGEWHE